jgi:dTDP-4-amino-4,6-dideoxygalactose transaminase
MINITQSFLPPLKEYISYLEGIWERRQLTNHGPLVLELEERIKEYLGVKHFFFVNNGTTALLIALKALELKKEVITTPFSYVATTSSLVWEGCKPVFADVKAGCCTIDPNSIEEKLTDQTEGILATHVYGNPCDVEAIEAIAGKYNLKVIYDAAHGFGVKYKNRSVSDFGDISTLSFHATKLFHTIEGGGIVTSNDALAHRISYMRNFGHNGPEQFYGTGINGKGTEFQAAMGLCILPRIDEIITVRKSICERYMENLIDLPLEFLQIQEGTTRYNYAYFPVFFESEAMLLKVVNKLELNNIIGRRYFYPSLNTLDYVDNNLPKSISENIAARVLCLPLSIDLKVEEIDTISNVIHSAFRHSK